MIGIFFDWTDPQDPCGAVLSFDFQVLMTFNKIFGVPHEANIVNKAREHLAVYSKKSAR